MELPNGSIDSLNILLNSNIITDDHFDKLLSACKELTLVENTNGKNASDEIDIMKIPDFINASTVYGNIVGLLVEAARHKYDNEHFINFLRTSKVFHCTRAEKLSNVYAEQREKLISHLSIIGNNFPYIVDVNWKLNYCIQKSANNFMSGCFYHIRLVIKKYDLLDYVQFTCNRHQLQELIYQLRDIIRHLEKFFQN